MFAHNGHRFDNIFLLPFLLKYFGTDVSFGGSEFNFKFLKISKYIDFIDTCDLIPGKLRDLAEEFKVEHRKEFFDFTQITEENLKSDNFKDKLLYYC